MKSGVVMVVIGDFIFMLLRLDLVLYIEGYLYILYVTYSRLIVLLSMDYVTLYFASTVRVWALCGVPNLWGVSPLTSS